MNVLGENLKNCQWWTSILDTRLLVFRDYWVAKSYLVWCLDVFVVDIKSFLFAASIAGRVKHDNSELPAFR